MFKHILVPLDGSHLAESALPVAVSLSKAFGSTVTLIHIIEHNAPQEIHGERHLREQKEAYDYLDQVARQNFPPEIKVIRHVHTEEVKNVARSIVEHSGELSPDLIVMCSHGAGGLRDIMVGSIAQQVISRGKTPILLVQPDENRSNPTVTFSRLLIPLDGDPEHEKALPLAKELAKSLNAKMDLLMVVYTLGTLPTERAVTSRLLPAATSVMLDMTESSAQDYLQEKAASFQAEGLNVSWEVRRGDPAANIIETAEQSSSDLIILATHGKSGMEAFWAGSVAPRVVTQTHIPLLLVPVR
ncbi:MAG TPA: universal stress protein [Anaerolineaceae bacterium]|nr:universal stress protein [Anaerolineaceae bacterium]